MMSSLLVCIHQHSYLLTRNSVDSQPYSAGSGKVIGDGGSWVEGIGGVLLQRHGLRQGEPLFLLHGGGEFRMSPDPVG